MNYMWLKLREIDSWGHCRLSSQIENVRRDWSDFDKTCTVWTVLTQNFTLRQNCYITSLILLKFGFQRFKWWCILLPIGYQVAWVILRECRMYCFFFGTTDRQDPIYCYYFTICVCCIWSATGLWTCWLGLRTIHCWRNRLESQLSRPEQHHVAGRRDGGG